MNKQKPDPGPSALQPNIRTLVTNLRFLGFDESEGWSDISPEALASRDAGPSQKLRVQATEWILYRLFEVYDSERAFDKLRPFFPAFEPLQSLNLRAALFRCLNQLKIDGTLGKDVILRKSMFDDCKGGKFIELLVAFSTLVLGKVVAGMQEGKGSITRSLCLDKQPQTGQPCSSLPLAIAHRSALKIVLQKRADLRARYKKFGQSLDMMDREVNQRFDKVVNTQEFLDQNIAPEATVARVAKQFDEHWQGNQGYVKAVTEGVESTVQDAFLDRPFNNIWFEVNEGTFSPDFALSRQGLLEVLEGRVAAQNARLQQWKDYKCKMQSATRASPKPAPPVRRADILSAKGRATEKELVFSPRKSPRKSEFPPPTGLDVMFAGKPSKDFLKRRQSLTHSKTKVSPSSQMNNSGFSEISDQEITGRLNLAQADSPAIDQDVERQLDTEDFDVSIKQTPISLSSPHDDAGYLPSNWEVKQTFLRNGPQDRENQAKRIVPNNLNAEQTPSKSISSLEERTRQSMAFASPGAHLTSNTSPPKRYSIATRPAIDHHNMADPDALKPNLVDRTRKSVSLIQARPKPRRSTMHNRRDSRIYPINQFETPSKAGLAKELTPPEELFSPRAGYDSVFRSRPRVGFSPATSPTGELEIGENGILDEEVKMTGVGSSPLAGKVGMHGVNVLVP